MANLGKIMLWNGRILLGTPTDAGNNPKIALDDRCCCEPSVEPPADTYCSQYGGPLLVEIGIGDPPHAAAGFYPGAGGFEARFHGPYFGCDWYALFLKGAIRLEVYFNSPLGAPKWCQGIRIYNPADGADFRRVGSPLGIICYGLSGGMSGWDVVYHYAGPNHEPLWVIA